MKPAVLTAAVVLAAFVPHEASAQALVVGVVRDQDGRAVANATIRAFDAAGGLLASGRSDLDGTFAVDVPSAAAGVEVAPRFGVAQRFAVRGDDAVIAIVRRYRAPLDAPPSPADLAALPNAAATAVLGVVPFAVTFPSAVSDRYLSAGRGAVLLDGIGFYRHLDGGDALAALPSGAVGALTQRSPLEAPAYGDRAGGGVFDLDLVDGGDATRLGPRSAVLRLPTRAGGATIAASWDPDPRLAAGVRLRAALGENRLTFDGLAAGTRADHLAGAAASFERPGRTGDLRAKIAAAADASAGGGSARVGSRVEVALAARGRGTVVPELALHAFRDTGAASGLGTADAEDAAVAGVTFDDGSTRARALLAAQADRTPRRSRALVPSLSFDRRLAARFSLHAGAGGSTVLEPYHPFDDAAARRGTLLETSLRYADGARWRWETVAYRERRDTTPATTLDGAGLSVGWQIAPRLGVRAWHLVAGDVTAPSGSYAGLTPARTAIFRRDVVWFTYESAVRLDALVRDGALEASLNVPIGSRLGLRVAVYRRLDRVRVATFMLAAPAR